MRGGIREQNNAVDCATLVSCYYSLSYFVILLITHGRLCLVVMYR